MVELLIVRHAIAQDRLESLQQGIDDFSRPLTEEGQRRMELATMGLKQLQQEIGLLLTSPLKRAQQTTNILAKHYPNSRVKVLDSLSPEHSPQALIRSLKSIFSARITLVGHEPQLSALITTLLCVNDDDRITLKKAGMAMLRFDDEIAAGEGNLQWLLKPKQLRLLGTTR